MPKKSEPEQTPEAPFGAPNTGPEGNAQNEEALDEQREADLDEEEE